MTTPGDSDRLPFDPQRMRARQEPDVPPSGAGGQRGEPAALTVSRLTQMIRGALAGAFPNTLHVLGEASNVSRAGTGHVYFTLKDANSELRCVLWRSDAVRVRFDLADGLQVIASGKLEVYEPRGQYQFYVKSVQPRGVGALELAFQQLKEKLAKEGLFDAARKRPLPVLPRTIGIVTSETGAAIRDMIHTIERRFPKVRLITKDVRVQGAGAAAEIAAAIHDFSRHADALGGVDVLIVGRGGGSLEDLWAFNEEIVARAIVASRIPVVSAVGHEVDFTIADFVADVRAATPTAAAELVVPVLAEVELAIASVERRMRRALTLRVARLRERVAAVARTAWFRDPVRAVRRRHQQLDELFGRLRSALRQSVALRRRRVGNAELKLVRSRPVVVLERRRVTIGRAEHRLLWSMRERLIDEGRALAAAEGRLLAESPRVRIRGGRTQLADLERRLRRGMVARLAAAGKQVETVQMRLAASSPQSVLKRGFSITRLRRGRRIVRDPADVRPGDRVLTETAAGEFQSEVVDSRQGELFQ